MAKDKDGFARDLGYLDAFFDKLDARGISMGGAAGARLRAFVGEERRRWSEVRALLDGSDQAARPAFDSSKKMNSDVPVPADADNDRAETTPRFTVGSLRSMRDRGKQF